ncbi:MAG: protein-glutamate O-methyltransferase CheR [Candidatus Omnitrophica bacterium]|nr:protein-glutamate O-methyltransferase CheR [Candidatus Omnitrophota bacterium]
MDRTLTPQFDDELKLLLEAIYLKYNYDFRRYAPASMKRTVVHALDRMGWNTLSELQEKVLQDTDCFYDLLQSLTIPVSEMFRDPSYFRALREKVFPHLKTYPSLKIWVAGCSTGEEAYSLAILLQEEDLLERTTLYATDINPRSLERAEKGVLSGEVLQKFTRNYQESGGKRPLADYYTAAVNSVKFVGTLKKNITFTDHSLVTDEVFAETQLISCRNVLIYFDRGLQDQVFGLFNASLCRKGFLGLGAQETIQFSKQAKHFDLFVKKDRIFQKKG